MKLENLSGGKPTRYGFAIIYPETIIYLKEFMSSKSFDARVDEIDVIAVYSFIASRISTKYPFPRVSVREICDLLGEGYTPSHLDDVNSQIDIHSKYTYGEFVGEAIDFVDRIISELLKSGLIKMMSYSGDGIDRQMFFSVNGACNE